MDNLDIKAEISPLGRDAEERLTGGFAVLNRTDDSGGELTNGGRCINGRCDNSINGRNCKNEISCVGSKNERRCDNKHDG